ncbi:MAG: hypothetical protein V3W31_09620 [Thermodesulfobacteriota bacterium]
MARTLKIIRVLTIPALVTAAAISLAGVAGAAGEEDEGTGLPRLGGTISLKDVFLHRDGGTTCAVIVDSERKSLVICFDRRVDTETPFRIYAGARHPSEDGALLIPRGGREEARLISMLWQALDERLSIKEQDALMARTIIEEAIEGVEGLSDEEWGAWVLLRALKGNSDIGVAVDTK